MKKDVEFQWYVFVSNWFKYEFYGLLFSYLHWMEERAFWICILYRIASVWVAWKETNYVGILCNLFIL